MGIPEAFERYTGLRDSKACSPAIHLYRGHGSFVFTAHNDKKMSYATPLG